jgi:hypothetical protein
MSVVDSLNVGQAAAVAYATLLRGRIHRRTDDLERP